MILDSVVPTRAGGFAIRIKKHFFSALLVFLYISSDVLYLPANRSQLRQLILRLLKLSLLFPCESGCIGFFSSSDGELIAVSCDENPYPLPTLWNLNKQHLFGDRGFLATGMNLNQQLTPCPVSKGESAQFLSDNI